MAEAQVAPDTIGAIQSILAAEPQGEDTQLGEDYQPEQNAQVEGEEVVEETGIPLDQLEAMEVEVEVSGEGGKVTEKPTVKELKLGYMRQKDYQQKTAEVARQREEISEKTRQAIEGELTRQQESLQVLQEFVVSAIAPELADINWADLVANNPSEWAVKRQRADQITQVLEGIKARQQEIASQKQVARSQATQERALKAIERLEAEIPGWSDDKYKELMKAGKDYGFKPEEVGAWLDPRAVRVLHDAIEYRKLQSGKSTIDKRVVVPPKVIKPGAQGAPAQIRQAEAMKRLQGSGKLDDAAAVIRARLGV